MDNPSQAESKDSCGCNEQAVVHPSGMKRCSGLQPKGGDVVKQQSTLSKRERNSILYAVAIGDGYVYKPKNAYIKSKNINFYKNCRLIIAHSLKQANYLRWKMKLISSILDRDIKVHKYNYSKYSIIKFSIANKKFNKVWKRMYRNGKKVMTRKILNRLDGRGLAIWYMDDGSLSRMISKKDGYKYNIVSIYTCCFSEEEHKIMCDYFKEKWGIRCKYYKCGGYYRLCITCNAAKRFIEIIKPYIIPSMKYKIVLW